MFLVLPVLAGLSPLHYDCLNQLSSYYAVLSLLQINQVVASIENFAQKGFFFPFSASCCFSLKRRKIG
jgi:hypothetical protein